MQTLDLVVEEAKTEPYPQNQLQEEVVVVKSPLPSVEVAVNQSQRLEEGGEGSPVGPRSNRPWVGVGVEEGGCPLQVDVEGSWLAGVSGMQQVLGTSWQLKEVVEEGVLGLEVVGGESQLMVEVEHFQSPEVRENSMIQHVQEEDKVVF